MKGTQFMGLPKSGLLSFLSLVAELIKYFNKLCTHSASMVLMNFIAGSIALNIP